MIVVLDIATSTLPQVHRPIVQRGLAYAAWVSSSILTGCSNIGPRNEWIVSMSKRKNNYYLLSLGCSKNTVDSESMAQLLNKAGMNGVGDAQRAEVLIVNTCGFINAAKEESLNALRDLAAHKKGDQLLIAAGCMAQR